MSFIQLISPWTYDSDSKRQHNFQTSGGKKKTQKSINSWPCSTDALARPKKLTPEIAVAVSTLSCRDTTRDKHILCVNISVVLRELTVLICECQGLLS